MSNNNNNSDNKDNCFISLNSLITINLISDDNQNSKISKYILRKENSDEKLAFKICKKPLLEYIDLSESLFFIRDIEECSSIYSKKSNEKENIEISSNEQRFIKNDKINQNTQFYLQHMISGKFISTEIIVTQNKITMKLLNDIDNACPFSLKKINEARSSNEFLSYSQLFYLNILIKEENQFYYAFEQELISDEIDKYKKYFEILLNKKAITKFCVINQSWMINNTSNIYSSQLINIIFTCNLKEKQERYMLGIEQKKYNLIDSDILNAKNYKVVPYPYKEELHEQILKKAFWVLEERASNFKEDINRKPVKIGEDFRIKNPSTGLYLNIRQKIGIKSSKNFDLLASDYDKCDYEFYLVDEQSLNDNLFIQYNFKLCHYIINSDSSYIMDDGKYILKGIFKNFNKNYIFQSQLNEKFHFENISSYYLPISLYFNNISNIISSKIAIGLKRSSIWNEIVSKAEFCIKNEDDFIFNIKKIGILEGSQVHYIHKIILVLEKDLKENQLDVTQLNEWINFLIKYLLNLEYSFRDNNHETNVPIKDRQILLWKFNVIKIIRDIVIDLKENTASKVQSDKQFLKLLSNITRFLLYLSRGNEDIKISIYVILLNLFVDLCELVMYDDNSKLIEQRKKLLYFIFDLVMDSEILQSNLLGDSSLLKKYIYEDEVLSKMKININNLIKVNKILEFIETSPDFLVLYQKLLNLNKVHYKKEEIARYITSHIEQVKFKEKNEIDQDSDNYIRIMKNNINEAKCIIKNHAILLDRKINGNAIKTSKTKYRKPYIPNFLLDFQKSKQKIKSKTIKNSEEINISDINKNEEKDLIEAPQIGSKITKLICLESKVSSLENDSEITKSIHPLLNNDSNNELNNDLSNNLFSKESERQGLLERNHWKRNSISFPQTSSGILRPFSNLNSIKNISKSLRKDKKQKEEKNQLKEQKSKDDYINILNKLGKIWNFIKWYETFDFCNSLFAYDNFLKEVFNNKIKNDIKEKHLFYFIDGKMNFSPIFIKDVKINVDSKTGILYLLRLFNSLFPKIVSNIENKINKKENITGKDILDDMKENTQLDPIYEDKDYDQLSNDYNRLHKYLCFFYSSYQFYINQYVRVVHKLFFALSNYFINFDNFGDIKQIKECFMKTLQILFSKITFLDDNLLSFLYDKIKINPSLMKESFNVEEIKEKFIQIFKKGNNTFELISTFSLEKSIIDFLFLMCKKCDKIRYLYEKISVFKYIRKLLFSKKNSEKDFDNEVEKKFKVILSLINSRKRLPLLLLYEKLSNKNKVELTKSEIAKISYLSYIKDIQDKGDSFSTYFYEIFKIGPIINFITKILKHYEIEEFFNNIIYLENKEIYISNNNRTIKKIRQLKEHFLYIEEKILKIKINSNSEEVKNMENNLSKFKVNKKVETNKKDFENIYQRLIQIRNDSLDCFDEEIYENKSENLLYKLFIMENKTFFEKLHFTKTLNIMIEAIYYFKDYPKEKNLYVSNLLRIFSKIKIDYPNFNKTIQENFESYNNLIVQSLEGISQYPENLIDLNTQTIFLNIFYYGIESFLYIIRNCKKDFSDIVDFIKNVFKVILSFLNKFKSYKNKLYYQLLYLYALCRILLYLNGDRTYDFSQYKSFIEEIFPMNNSLLFNINQEMNKTYDAEFRGNNYILIENDNSLDNIVTNRNNMDISNSNVNYFPNEMQTYKLESPKNQINNTLNQKDFKEEGTKKEQYSKYSKEPFELYDEKEIKRLDFYVSFLLVYSLYLNEKNSMSKDEDEIKKDRNTYEELSLDSLYLKLKKYFLQYKVKENSSNNYNNINLTLKSKEYKSSFFNSFYFENEEIKGKTLIDNENIIINKTNKNGGYLFIFALIQAIVNFQHSSRNSNIEIPIKIKNKRTEEKIESEEINENESDILLTKNNNNSIIFYYYEAEHIDIILLEKIMNEMSLKNNLKNYCLELVDNENSKVPEILQNFMEYQTYYKLISNYCKNEYVLVNSLFIKNNMAILLKDLFNTFNQEDFTEIESMKFFMYKKMGEIYKYEDIKIEEDISQKSFNLIKYLKKCEKNKNEDLDKINLLVYLESLLYIYPKYDKDLCLLYYKIGFEILFIKSILINKKKNEKDFDKPKEEINLELTIKLIKFLFNRKSNRILIEDKYVFDTMLYSLRELYKNIIKNNAFVLKHVELIKEFLWSLDFILGHLSKDFIKLVNFLKRPENLNDLNKYKKKKKKLIMTLDFFITLINFKKNYEEKVLTEQIKNFEKEIIERVIKLLFLLLEIDKDKSIEIMNILLDFLFDFVKGPDIENINMLFKGPDIDNLNMLFSSGFFELVSFVITNVDYYKIFLNYLSKDNMHEVIDKFSKIECRILKIFIAYYNVSYSSSNKIEEFEKLQHWYENNFNNIKKKLKKLYYISEKEMEFRQYDINKMLLFINPDDDYNDNFNNNDNDNNNLKNDKKEEIADILIADIDDNANDENDSENEKNKEINNNQKKYQKFCIIKFDLLLFYYTLFNYHKDLSDIQSITTFTQIKKKKNNIFYWIINFFIDLVIFVFNLVIVTIFFLYFFFKRFSLKIKKDVDLLQSLSDIDEKSESISEEKIINFLKKYIREVEISINKVIYKIYFPMIDKSNTLDQYRKEYLKVDQIDSADFTNYLLSNYDYINIKAKQNSLINKWINEFPILNYIFKNMFIYTVFLIILGILSNLLIMVSYNTFVETECDSQYKFAKSRQNIMLQCPRFLYNDDSDPKNVVLVLKALGVIELILQGMTFIDYFIRILAIESEIVKLNFKYNGSIFSYLFDFFFPTIGRCVFNFQTIYYLISLFCLSLGIAFHPFFNGIILLEFVNRIPVMQAILKAMYRPAKNILITLLMFIILEYFFSFFAVSWFTYHFPNETDTKNFLKTFMRMVDQTFKQDGGIGTYLDKSLDDNYVPFSARAYFNLRFFFDLIFYLIILSLIFPMFLSIIIDYFNETRENTENFEENLETQCIVCGIDREKIEKINPNDKDSFNKHIKYYHNVFNYIYYLMYLQSSSSRDVIIDNNVWNLHLIKNLSYLPKNICFKQLEKKCWKKLNQRKNKEN